MNEAGIGFRVTKDLDVVLSVEALDDKFGRMFWNFIKAGGYRIQKSMEGQSRFSRFVQPQSRVNKYPVMVELFSRRPDILTVPDWCHLTPIPLGQELSSLSAILLDDDYYRFICSGKMEMGGVIILDAEHLIPLKASAWINLTRQGAERNVISKHKNDIFRLYQIINPAFKAQLPSSIRTDMEVFLDAMDSEMVDLKSLGLRGKKKEEIIVELRGLYGLD